jgi:hypothetical protein
MPITAITGIARALQARMSLWCKSASETAEYTFFSTYFSVFKISKRLTAGVCGVK